MTDVQFSQFFLETINLNIRNSVIVSDNQLFNQQQAAEHTSQTSAAAAVQAVQESASENNNDRKSVVSSGESKIILKLTRPP